MRHFAESREEVIGNWCRADQQRWPCETAQLATALIEARAAGVMAFEAGVEWARNSELYFNAWEDARMGWTKADKAYRKERKRRKAWRATAKAAGRDAEAAEKRVVELEKENARQFEDWTADVTTAKRTESLLSNRVAELEEGLRNVSLHHDSYCRICAETVADLAGQPAAIQQRAAREQVDAAIAGRQERITTIEEAALWPNGTP
jgi:hypothetical protein